MNVTKIPFEHMRRLERWIDAMDIKQGRRGLDSMDRHNLAEFFNQVAYLRLRAEQVIDGERAR